MNLAEETAQSGQKNQRDQYQDKTNAHHHVVNEERQKTEPESGVLHARHGGVRGNGHGATRCWSRKRCSQHWRVRWQSGNRKRLSAIRAKRGTIRHRCATLGTVHDVSLSYIRAVSTK